MIMCAKECIKSRGGHFGHFQCSKLEGKCMQIYIFMNLFSCCDIWSTSPKSVYTSEIHSIFQEVGAEPLSNFNYL
jgi:hypothetical protein